MFLLPGVLISILTFPGVIVHELSHQIICRLMGVPVYEVKYFQAKNPCGYVIHEASDRPFTNFMIAIGPFLINTLAGACLLLPVSIEMSEFRTIFSFGGLHVFFMLIAYWFGISILMHAFPSQGDAKVLISEILNNKEVGLITRILVAPVVGLIYLGAIGSMFWLDLFYAIAIAFALPKLVALFL